MKKQTLFLAVLGFTFLISSFGLLIVGEIFEKNEVYYKVFHLTFAIGVIGSLGFLFSSIETKSKK